jgi:L-serine dehydratase
MLAWPGAAGMDLAGLAAAYESARGGIPPAEVAGRMAAIVRILRRSVAQGLAGTRFDDRILGHQSGAFQAAAERRALLDAGLLNRMIACVTALMEVKSSMGVIVAAPTAGSCGALPGAVIGASEGLGLGETEMTRAMLAAGMIGVFVAAHATFAAEVCGCQAECGAGSGMAAAALVTLAGGSARRAVDAASMAMQNVLGMVCDPVANRVEVPCLGRNVLAAANALACANMALAGFDAVVPLDEVIGTMLQVGRSLPAELRCTAKGGLSITPAARRIEARLNSSGRGSH